MARSKVDVHHLLLDELGRVILSEEELEHIAQSLVLPAGGSNSACDDTTNGTCTNLVTCNGSLNISCTNSFLCDDVTNTRCGRPKEVDP